MMRYFSFFCSYQVWEIPADFTLSAPLRSHEPRCRYSAATGVWWLPAWKVQPTGMNLNLHRWSKAHTRD